MKNRIPRFLWVIGLAGVIFSCSKKEMPSPVALRPNSAGAYAALYQVLEKESKADDILMIKDGSSKVEALMKDIAEISKQMAGELEKWGDKDTQLQAINMDFPSYEREVRSAKLEEQSKRILLERGGSFDKHLLLTQTEALPYARHLMSYLEDHEADAAHKRFLSQSEKKFDELEERAVEILDVHSQ